MVLSPVEFLHSPPSQPAAVIHLTIPRSEIQKVMGPAIQEILAAIKQQQQQATSSSSTDTASKLCIQGPMFAHHLMCDEAMFDFHVGFPTNEPIDVTTITTGRVIASRTPTSDKVAKVTYTGPYEGLHDAWSTFGDRLSSDANNSVSRKGNTLWEVYTVGPETTSDPEHYQTDLFLPIE